MFGRSRSGQSSFSPSLLTASALSLCVVVALAVVVACGAVIGAALRDGGRAGARPLPQRLARDSFALLGFSPLR